MKTPYDNILKLNKTIKSTSWIGAYEEGNDVYLYRRENGERKVYRIQNVPRYFAINKEDYKKISKAKWEQYKKDGLFDTGYFQGKYGYLISTYTGYKSNWNRWLQELHNSGIEPLEADITRTMRLVIDLDLKITNPNCDDIGQRPKIAFFDIETEDRGKIDIGKDRILSVAIKEYDTKEEFFYCLEELSDESEAKFLSEVYKKLLSYDSIWGFNNFGFDDLYIEERLKYLNIDLSKWKRICHGDYFNQFERQGTFTKFETKDRKLDTISKVVLGEGKIDHKEKIWQLWENNKELLKKYNLQDIKLLCGLEEKLNTANLIMSMMSYAGIPYNISHSPLRLVETFLLRQANLKRENDILDFRFPTAYYLPEHNLNSGSPFARNSLSADRRKDRAEQLAEMGIEYNIVEGGYVKESDPAYERNVAAFDFNSLYPYTIISHNICYTTLLDDIEKEDNSIPKNVLPNGTAFRTDKRGLMSESVELLLNERKKVKAQMSKEKDVNREKALDIIQYALKVLANSFFGVCGLYGSRLYSEKIGNAITSLGRFALPMADEYFTAMGRKVVIQDTDSTYLTLRSDDDPQVLVNDFIEIFRKELKRKFNTYRPEVLKMAYEKKYSSLIVVGKKMYAGLCVMEDGVELEKPKIVIKGLGLKKSTACKWGEQNAKKILDDLLFHNYTYDHYERLIKQKREELLNGEIPLDHLRFSNRLGREIDEYKNKTPNIYVRLASRLKENGYSITSHMTINYYITDGNTPAQGIAEEEITNGGIELDIRHYFNIGFLQIVNPILYAAFPEGNWDQYKFEKKLKRNGYLEVKRTFYL